MSLHHQSQLCSGHSVILFLWSVTRRFFKWGSVFPLHTSKLSMFLFSLKKVRERSDISCLPILVYISINLPIFLPILIHPPPHYLNTHDLCHTHPTLNSLSPGLSHFIWLSYHLRRPYLPDLSLKNSILTTTFSRRLFNYSVCNSL